MKSWSCLMMMMKKRKKKEEKNKIKWNYGENDIK